MTQLPLTSGDLYAHPTSYRREDLILLVELGRLI